MNDIQNKTLEAVWDIGFDTDTLAFTHKQRRVLVNFDFSKTLPKDVLKSMVTQIFMAGMRAGKTATIEAIEEELSKIG